MGGEFAIAIMIFGVVISILLVAPILAIIALVRANRVGVLQREVTRIAQELLELQELRQQLGAGAVGRLPVPVKAETPVSLAEASPFGAVAQEVNIVAAEGVEASQSPPATLAQPVISSPHLPFTPARRRPDTASIELFLGRQALGWVAVVVLLFGTGFFLRYAYENEWVGPLGRVSIGILAGVALVVAGWHYDRKGWRSFSRMLTTGGVLVLYLSNYSAFGVYHLVPQNLAGVLLLVVVAESALLALVYDSWGVALLALIGGLITPVLMQSDRDQYVSLFTYLAILNAGSLALLVRRAWYAIGTIALVGTQWLFWLWYFHNYHPEKLAWAAGFQLTLYALHWGYGLASSAWRRQSTTAEEIVRSSLNATALFAALYILLVEQHRPWLGTVALMLAAVESFGARLMLFRVEVSQARLLTSVAIAVGFIALAFPLQADAHWVAVGWAAQAAVLAWCGLRVESTALRAWALVLAAFAVVRVVVFNAPWAGGRLPFVPIWNDFAAPSLVVVLLLGAGVYASRRRLARGAALDRVAAGLTVVACVLLTWLILSFDVYQFCRQFALASASGVDWRRVAQMSLSAWWAIYASAVLGAGFWAQQSLLRWSALGLYALTVLKVFVVDMAGLDQIYRIVAFLLLAVLMGAAAWAYQQLTPRSAGSESESA